MYINFRLQDFLSRQKNCSRKSAAVCYKSQLGTCAQCYSYQKAKQIAFVCVGGLHVNTYPGSCIVLHTHFSISLSIYLASYMSVYFLCLLYFSSVFILILLNKSILVCKTQYIDHRNTKTACP